VRKNVASKRSEDKGHRQPKAKAVDDCYNKVASPCEETPIQPNNPIPDKGGIGD